jgi:pimeloyl-ACP methyl ester carboxylesterase
MKQIILGFLFLLAISKGYSQSNVDIAHKIGFEYFAIKDTFRISTEDSIRFIVSNYNDNKPFLLFVQGSGNLSLIEKINNKYKLYLNELFPDSAKSAYRMVFILKPGVPLSIDKDQTDNSLHSRLRGDYFKFIQNDFLDYYVSAAKQTIDYLKAKAPNKTKLYVVGHSQGYQVIAKLAAYFPNNIDKAVCMSSNPFGQLHTQSIYKIRQEELLGHIEPKKAQLKVDSIYNHLSNVLEWFEWSQQHKSDTIDQNYSFFRNDYSFNCELAIDNLVKIKCPLLIVYGTADIASTYNDLLPFFFARSNRNNLTMQCYPGYDHNYFYHDHTKDGNLSKDEFNWPLVFGNIDKWLKKNNMP